MTTTVEAGKILMYRGRVHEIFLIADGKISYVILKNCARFYMNFGDDAPTIGRQLELFSGEEGSRRRVWDYLLIEGSNIANILFDPSAETIRVSDEGRKALMKAIEELRKQNLLSLQEVQRRP